MGSFRLGFLSIIALLSVFGCAKDSTTESVANPSGATHTASTTTNTIRIAVIPKSTSHAFWQTVKAGAEAAGKEAGAEIVWTGPSKETDITAQIDILQNEVSGKVDGIVLA